MEKQMLAFSQEFVVSKCEHDDFQKQIKDLDEQLTSPSSSKFYKILEILYQKWMIGLLTPNQLTFQSKEKLVKKNPGLQLQSTVQSQHS